MHVHAHALAAGASGSAMCECGLDLEKGMEYADCVHGTQLWLGRKPWDAGGPDKGDSATRRRKLKRKFCVSFRENFMGKHTIE